MENLKLFQLLKLFESVFKPGLQLQLPHRTPRSLNGSATSLSSLDTPPAGSRSPSSPPRNSRSFGKKGFMEALNSFVTAL